LKKEGFFRKCERGRKNCNYFRARASSPGKETTPLKHAGRGKQNYVS